MPHGTRPSVHRLRPPLVALVLLCLNAAPAPAWSPDGHRLAGHIAWLSLSAQAQREVDALLTAPGRLGGDYATLAEASVWPDAFARQSGRHDWAGPLHYVNVEPSAVGYRRQRDCPRGRDCVVEAIHRFAAVLAERTRPRAERREALLFLAHFVQDIHQPLHVAHPDGRGGNDTLVYWFDRERNLHQVWDDGIPGRFLAREYGWDWLLGPAWQRHAEKLAQAQVPEPWLAADSPEAWAAESLGLAREHTYGIVSGMALGSTYYDQTAPVAMERIHQAGVRLAAMLEELVVSASANASA